MEKIKEVKENISNELDTFNSIFNSAFATDDILLKQMLDHVLKQKGKQIRPILTISFAKLIGEANKQTFYGTAAIELLHTASLIHDDVIDESTKRRNSPSVNAVFDNKKAILVGDYLLTKAMHFMAETENMEMIKSITSIAKLITEGELLQLQLAYSLPTETEYLDIISKKTAILFYISASVAAISTSTNGTERTAIENFARYLGMCFQIKDDILDYTKNAEIGKPIFNDIREGKITLPLLHAFELMPTEDRNYLMRNIKSNCFNSEIISLIYNSIFKYKGIEYATEKMEEYHKKAIAELAIFPDSIEKNALITIADYLIVRKN